MSFNWVTTLQYYNTLCPSHSPKGVSTGSAVSYTAPLLTMTSLGSMSCGPSVISRISMCSCLLEGLFSCSSAPTCLARWGVSSGGTLGGASSGSWGGGGLGGLGLESDVAGTSALEQSLNA